MTKKTENIEATACPVSFCMSKIGGKWKPVIIYLIRKGGNRFGILAKNIEGISRQMLTKQLRELEADGVLIREVFAEVPPRVEYSFTPLGESLFPVIDAMSAWGLAHMKEAPAPACSGLPPSG